MFYTQSSYAHVSLLILFSIFTQTRYFKGNFWAVPLSVYFYKCSRQVDRASIFFLYFCCSSPLSESQEFHHNFFLIDAKFCLFLKSKKKLSLLFLSDLHDWLHWKWFCIKIFVSIKIYCYICIVIYWTKDYK